MADATEIKIMSKDSMGNGLGRDNAKSWNPKSMRTYEKNKHAGAGQSKVEDEKRKGAGQK